VKIVATAPTVRKIEESLAGKLAFWPPQMGANAPTKVVPPEVLSGNTLTVEGQTLEIRGLDDRLPHRSYVWIPAIKAIVGGINVFAGIHVWTADTATVEDRAAWLKKLDDIAALKPSIVVPGHSAPNQPRDISGHLHANVPATLRGRTQESAWQRAADCRDEGGLSECGVRCGARYWRQGDQARNEMVRT
jgi:glyoxylase-like metal-dependent hydrolase (beta-lactamase superfamily II)